MGARAFGSPANASVVVAMTESTENYLEKMYEQRFSSREEYRRKVWQTLVSDWFRRYIPADGAVLDLGCGYGEFINAVKGPVRYAMDLNPSSKQHVDRGVRLFQQDCSQEWPLQDASLGLVFTSNFLEHLPSKAGAEAAFRQAWRCLKPGGRFVALGPNVKYLPGAYWDFWDHHLPITETSLSEGLQMAGFKIEKVFPRFLPYTMASGRQYPVLFLRAYLRCPIVWPFLGRQFLVIATK